MALGATVKDLRHRNRARVLRHIVLARETTRARAAAECHLSTATITNVVGDLISEGLVHEVGSVPSDGGRPIARLAMRPQGGHVIGAGVGEHGIRVELFDLALNNVDRVNHVFRTLPTHIASVDEVATALTKAVATLRGRHPDVALVGMGLGVPGLVERSADERVTVYADQLGWPATDLHDLCRIDDLPLFADNGARTLALAEQWFGAARGVTHAVVALVGRGLGVGLISAGQLLHGATSSAGEWGHTKIEFGGRKCTCGDHGCLDAYVGGGGIIARWSERSVDARHTIEAADRNDDALTALFDAAKSGDPEATAVLDETVELLGLGLANLVNLTNPEKVIIGGWPGLGLYAARSTELAGAIRRRCLPRLRDNFTLERCALGADALPFGAALLPLERLVLGTSL